MLIKKRVKDSIIFLHQLAMPEHANPLGKVHGGFIMKMADEAGGICAMRHAQRPAVTIAIDSMIFHSPVNVGDLIMMEAVINYVGNTSMEVGIKVTAENPITGEQTHTNSAYLVYVALDDEGYPVKVPELIVETEAEQLRWDAAKARQVHRLNQSAKKSQKTIKQ